MAGVAVIVAGMGCSTRARLPELRALLAHVTAGRRPDAIACPEARAAQIRPLADSLNLPLVTVPRAALRGVQTPGHSARIKETFGTGCVAEACALLVAGRGARIIAARQISEVRQATCALAQGEGQ